MKSKKLLTVDENLPTYFEAVQIQNDHVTEQDFDNDHYIDNHVPANKTTFFTMILLGFLYLVALKLLIVNETFAQVYRLSSFFANTSLCGIFGVFLGVLKSFAILWSQFCDVRKSKLFANFSQFIAIFFIIYSFYCVSIGICMAKGLPSILVAWIKTNWKL